MPNVATHLILNNPIRTVPSKMENVFMSTNVISTCWETTGNHRRSSVAPPGMVALPATTPNELRGGNRPSSFGRVWELQRLVERSNACALPGCTIKYDTFLPIMWRAVARGFVEHRYAVFVANGLRHGFEAGVQRHLLRGQRVFKNYKSAVEAMPQVARATQKRIDSGKTLMLGTWLDKRRDLCDEIRDFFVFPIGAVPKPLEPTEVRPASDHTRTGLNGATVLGMLAHALTAQRDVAWLLKTGYFMYVSDVEAAFPMLPLVPWLWWFMLHRVSLPSNAGRDTLCMHIFGDFGTRGMPGCFFIFYVKVVIQMAKSELIITLPITIYVDDNGLIGPHESVVNAQMQALQNWAEKKAGVQFKRIKDAFHGFTGAIENI